MRSGYVGPGDGKHWTANQWGFNWSSRASSTRYDDTTTPSAYNLHFSAKTVLPSNGPNERWHGFPLRCLSTVLGM